MSNVTITDDARPTERPAFDLLDPAFYLGDPHAGYRWMREYESVYRDEANQL